MPKQGTHEKTSVASLKDRKTALLQDPPKKNAVLDVPADAFKQQITGLRHWPAGLPRFVRAASVVYPRAAGRSLLANVGLRERCLD